jgi:hypothetical protein
MGGGLNSSVNCLREMSLNYSAKYYVKYWEMPDIAWTQ